MTDSLDPAADAPLVSLDPRALLAAWANDRDEWVRSIAGEVIVSGAPLSEAQVQGTYALFRQEKGLDDRELGKVEPLSTDATVDATAPPLLIQKLSEVQGVNALVPGSVIEPHEGLTILFGENGTGKTGYARIFKALAKSRTDDEILGDVTATTTEPVGAKVDYTVDDQAKELNWRGEHGVAPFTRMSIFDSPSVSYHVDADLDYVYVPAALALFNHVTAAVRGVQARVDERLKGLQSDPSNLLSRFPRGSSVYATVETLGASTDLPALKARANSDADADEQIDSLRRAVAALEADTIKTQITGRQREQRVLNQTAEIAAGLTAFEPDKYNQLLARRARLIDDYETFRSELFKAADLPAEPEETWTAFVQAGGDYRQHLVAESVHDADRCLYCRQTLDDPARDLMARYASYLENKINTDLGAVNNQLRVIAETIRGLAQQDVDTFITDHEIAEEKPLGYEALRAIVGARSELFDTIKSAEPWEGDLTALPTASADLSAARKATEGTLSELKTQAGNRADALKTERTKRDELIAAVEIGKSWTAIETRVNSAKEADQLTSLRRRFSGLQRQLTDLSKEASDQLINQSFDTLFAEECEALRAPALKVQFVGRDGRPQRRKVLTAEHRPSRVLSEGEQKVLAMADFLAEARLAGITAPVVFDDPVSSLDYRRINEVAGRVSLLSGDNQVIVFTHDIFFATTLLALAEETKRCSYFQITDENGKGQVTRATHPRWDTLNRIKAEINKTIETAEKQEGETRAALVRTGYDWIRSWCEVFTEVDLLRGVTQRYQPNVRMTTLSSINVAKLPELIETVTTIFESACRYIPGHSQPLPTLSLSPTLEGLKADWAKLQACKTTNDAS
jgi:hypothetical protein